MKFRRLNEGHELFDYKGYSMDINQDNDYEDESTVNYVTIYDENNRKVGDAKGLRNARAFIDKLIEEERNNASLTKANLKKYGTYIQQYDSYSELGITCEYTLPEKLAYELYEKIYQHDLKINPNDRWTIQNYEDFKNEGFFDESYIAFDISYVKNISQNGGDIDVTIFMQAEDSNANGYGDSDETFNVEFKGNILNNNIYKINVKNISQELLETINEVINNQSRKVYALSDIVFDSKVFELIQKENPEIKSMKDVEMEFLSDSVIKYIYDKEIDTICKEFNIQ